MKGWLRGFFKMGSTASEQRNWHIASWLAPTLIAAIMLAAGLIAVLAGLEMTALIAVLILALGLAAAVLWISSLPFMAKTVGSVILAFFAVISAWWVIKNDRPILRPEVAEILSQNFNGKQFGLDIEALIINTGRQSSYADDWKLGLSIDGSEMQGRQLYGQALPSGAVNEPELYNQEFPPGKPVRGWLFFGFPSMSYSYAYPYFACDSPLSDKVSITLSAWDAKTKREWSQKKSLKEMGKEACIPLPQPTPQPAVSPKPRKPTGAAPIASQAPSQPIAPPAVNFAPGGFATSGGVLINPQIYNLPDLGRVLNPDHFSSLIAGITAVDKGTVFLILYGPIDKEMNNFGGQLQAAFSRAGWTLPAIHNSHPAAIQEVYGPKDIRTNTPEGLHCVTDNSKIGKDLLKALSDAGVECSLSDPVLYPPPQPQPSLTIFMGRNLN